MRNPLTALWGWARTWPQPRWSWRTTLANAKPAHVYVVRTTDAAFQTIELRNSGGGSALDIEIQITRVVESDRHQWLGETPNLGPHTNYLVDIRSAPPDGESPTGVWAWVRWRNVDGSEDAIWARAEDVRGAATFVETNPPPETGAPGRRPIPRTCA